MTMNEEEMFDLIVIKVKVGIPQTTGTSRSAELADLIRSYIDKTMDSVEAHLRSLYEPHLVIKVEE